MNDILDISKIESGKLEIDSIPYMLKRVVFEAVRNQAARAHEKGLELVVELPSQLPSQLQGDPLRVGQVVTNLVGNAVKFTSAGEVAVTVEARGERLHIAVRDTGVGIPESRKDAIFDAFTQADGSTSRRFGGTGLGLTITRELVQRMGGRIWVDSVVGRGSTFNVELPLVVAVPSLKVLPSGLPNDFRVLIVDDNETARRAMVAALSEAGLSATATDPGSAISAALEALETNHPFSVALIDQLMPGASGLELCEALDGHDILATLPRVLLVNTVERPAAEQLERAHVARTLTKPVGTGELLDALASVARVELTSEHVTTTGVANHTTRALRVLLAEDNAINARLAMRLLEKLGHQARHVVNGKLAVDATARDAYDVVLMDLQMPELDGLEATKLIRAREAGHAEAGQPAPKVPVIALTANAMKGDDELCYSAGMDGYLTKPLDVEKLGETLRAIASTLESSGSGVRRRAASDTQTSGNEPTSPHGSLRFGRPG